MGWPFAGRTKYISHFQVNASSINGGTQVYNGNVDYSKHIFFFTMHGNVTNDTENGPTGLLAYDSFGGSYFPADAKDFPLSSSVATILGPYHFSTIPTPSALDLGGTSTVLSESDYERSYGAANPPLSPKSSPFANFITARDGGIANNEKHISFETRNGAWLVKELNNAPEIDDCSYICVNDTIVGPPLICNNTTNTFSLPALNGVTYTWSTSANLSIVNGQGSHTVQIHSNGTNGAETLTCVYGNTTCGNVTITRQVINGGLAPDYSVGMIAGTHYLGGQTVHITASTPTPGPLTWNWVVAGASITGGQGTSTVTILTDQPPYSANNTPLYLDLGVNTINSCGDPSPYYQLHAFVDADGLPEPLKIQAYPVPANQDITIASSKDGTAKEPFTCLVYDKLGKIVRTGKSNGEDISVKLADLSSDIYILHITVKGKTTQKQIIVQH